MNRGFTIVELMVSVAIFVVMTSLVMAKFGNLNQGTLLTDTAYDIALTLRTTQSYGLSVKNAGGLGGVNFSLPYGLNFNQSATADPCGATQTSIKLFADNHETAGQSFNGGCRSVDLPVSTYALTRGATIKNICVTANNFCPKDASGNTIYNTTELSVSFQRPNPDALICPNYNGTTCDPGATICGGNTCIYAEVQLSGSDGSTRTVAINRDGLISVQQQ